MTGDDRKRTCAQCGKQVFNLARMTRAEAEALLQERVDGVCVRLFRRGDGTILTADCPIGARAMRKVSALWGVLVTAIFGLLGIGVIRSLGTTVGSVVYTDYPPDAFPRSPGQPDPRPRWESKTR
jgi:hypothetical protein